MRIYHSSVSFVWRPTNERIGWIVARIAACWRVLNEFDGDGVHSGQSRQHKRYHEGMKLSETLPFNEAE